MIHSMKVIIASKIHQSAPSFFTCYNPIMRIQEKEALVIKGEVLRRLPNARVLLFGSRTKDALRGGDIDILVIGPRRLSFEEKSAVRTTFWKQFGEQKIDIASFAADEHPPFRELAEAEAIAL